MSAIDRQEPEYRVLLMAARRAMEGFKGRRGHYATSWYELGQDGFHTAARPYRTGEAGTVPTEADTHTWQPLAAQYRYRIAVATGDTFLIQALVADDTPFFEIRQGQRVPVNTATQQPWRWGDPTDF